MMLLPALRVIRQGALWLPVLFLFAPLWAHAASSDAERERIGTLIFQNECASKIECLTSWNENEDFASLGVGHFIWYPQAVSEKDKKFNESFPKFLAWMKKEDAAVPNWLFNGNPWQNRQDFMNHLDAKNMTALRTFLWQTRPQQVAFIQYRLEQALPTMLSAIDVSRHGHVEQQFSRMMASPMGLYALMDYVNFKGEGVKKSERYQGQGWGLLQVLAAMQGEQRGVGAIQEFAKQADFLLSQRVRLSPAERHEQRWLAGWKKRLQTYVNEAEKVIH